jgi:hypothetical protein
MSSGTACDVQIVQVAEEDATDMFDEVTQRAMGMAGSEFMQRWDAGEYEGVDFDQVPGLVEVWMYLPFVR